MNRKAHILVIEDNPADVALLRLALDTAGLEYDLTVLDDGAAAIEFIRQNASALPISLPDLTILDLNLPKSDGFEVLQAMRADKSFACMPVAVLSSSSSPRDRSRMGKFFVRRYITKPADLEEFMKIGLIVKEMLVDGHS